MIWLKGDDLPGMSLVVVGDDGREYLIKYEEFLFHLKQDLGKQDNKK